MTPSFPGRCILRQVMSLVEVFNPSFLALFKHGADVVWGKLLSIGLVELALELDPMQAQGVQETLQDIHAEQNAYRDAEPSHKHEVDHDAVERRRC
mmetsp:Transcript_15143/g.29807  ORF Transcript_15143/g.29807 Transcript_15143/m.29807 type:complete len:96 (+) Transcript_15143:24-311(+)